MKIALVGAQGVGKSTLAQRLLQKYPNSHIVKETVRECPYPIDQQADFKTEWWVLSHSILAERECEESGFDLIIADRCVLDISVYTKLINETGDGRISDRKRKLIDDVVSRWFDAAPYDLVFYVRVDSEIWRKRDIDDGFRSTDIAWYRTLDAKFAEAIEAHQVDKKCVYHEIYNNGSLDASLGEICQAIESHRAVTENKAKIVVAARR